MNFIVFLDISSKKLCVGNFRFVVKTEYSSK